MILGIDASRYGAEQPTGVEQYTDRVLQGLIQKAEQLGYQELRLYVRTAQQVEALLFLVERHGKAELIQVRLLPRKRFWTLLWLSWEMLRHPVDGLFVPSHTLPLWVPKRSFLTVHGVEALLFPEAYSWRQRCYQRFALWWAKRKKTQLIAVSQAVQKDVVEHFAVPEERIHVVWNGFDALAEETDSKESSFRVSGDYLLSVGRLENRKNQLRLIQAFEQLAESFPQLKLVLVGPDGRGADAIRQKAQQSAFSSRILLAGYQDREVVRSLMKGARVFAYPSLAEGFGIPILEAFDAECPVLTSKGSATEEVGGGAAVYCDALSVDSIAKGLRSLLEDASLCQQKMRDGQKRLDLFSWDRCRDELLQCLKESS